MTLANVLEVENCIHYLQGLYGCERQMGNGKGILQKVAHKWNVAKKIVAGETRLDVHLKQKRKYTYSH